MVEKTRGLSEEEELDIRGQPGSNGTISFLGKEKWKQRHQNLEDSSMILK